MIFGTLTCTCINLNPVQYFVHKQNYTSCRVSTTLIPARWQATRMGEIWPPTRVNMNCTPWPWNKKWGEHVRRNVTQQTRNHFWTSWHVSYWLIIGTAPPVCVFMCIHVNTRVLSVVTSFEQVWHESYWVRTGTVSLVCVITWKIRDFTVNTCRHTKFFHRIQWIHVRKHVNWASWTSWMWNMWNHGSLLIYQNQTINYDDSVYFPILSLPLINCRQECTQTHLFLTNQCITQSTYISEQINGQGDSR